MTVCSDLTLSVGFGLQDVEHNDHHYSDGHDEDGGHCDDEGRC